jgi:Na+/H+-dicarboxylate symporter
LSRTSKVLLALVAGLATGCVVSVIGSAWLQTIPRFFEPIGTLWVNALRMTVLPLILPALLLGVNALPDSRSVGRLGARSLGVFAGILAAAAAFAVIIGAPVFSHLKIAPAGAAALRARAELSSGEVLETAGKISGVGRWLTDLIPTNPMKAAADGSLLPLIVCTLIFGLALPRIAPTHREPFLRLVRTVYETALVVVGWVLIAAPLGVFALAVTLASQLGIAAAGAVAYYVATASALSLAFLGLLYLATRLFGGQSWRAFARAAAPAQAVAFSSRSSLAALPALLESADKTLGLPLQVRSFVLPLAAASFRPGGAIAIVTGVLFLARLYGIDPTPAQLVTVAALSVVTSISAPGIPGGSIIVMVPVLLATHLPVTAVGLLLAADAIPDLFRTVTNVTGDLAAATIIARFEPPDRRNRATYGSNANL